MTNPIETAVAPIKADAIIRAEQEARKYVETIREGLKAVGNDLDIYAPRPSNNIGREAYMMQSRRRTQIKSLCTTISSPDNFHSKKPYIVEINAERLKKFIVNEKENAALQYDMFVAKLVRKIGDTAAASITGNHVWGYSFLTVTLPSGEMQVWKTQQIVNRSVLGLLFNQWPSRKMKGGAQ